jgi:hypothetical protein
MKKDELLTLVDQALKKCLRVSEEHPNLYEGSSYYQMAEQIVEMLPAFEENQLRKALLAAVNELMRYEPPDSRCVSDLTVALASFAAGNENVECTQIVDAALRIQRKEVTRNNYQAQCYYSELEAQLESLKRCRARTTDKDTASTAVSRWRSLNTS